MTGNFSALAMKAILNGNNHLGGTFTGEGGFGGTGINPSLVGARMLAGAGRGDDTMIAHVTPGEMTLPPEAQTPEAVSAFARAIIEAGGDPERYVIGSPKQSINPETGQPEFGWFNSIKQAVSIAAPILGYAYGGSLGAGAASGATNYLFNRDLGRAATSAGLSYLGAELGDALNNRLGKLDIGSGLEKIIGTGNLPVGGFANAIFTTPLAAAAGAVAGNYLGDSAGSAAAEAGKMITGRPAGVATLPASGAPNSTLALPELAGSGGSPAAFGSVVAEAPTPVGVSFLHRVRNRNTGQVAFNTAPAPSPTVSRRWSGMMAV